MRPLIIAEVGINHGGNLQMAMKMIYMAKQAGADIVKFQLYKPESLLNKFEFDAEDWQQILQSELSWAQLQKLALYCDALDVEFMASAFDLQHLGWLEQLGVLKHKIASRSVYDKDYCTAVIKTGKPYMVSCGWIKENNPLKEPVHLTMKRFTGGRRRKFLYCISKYPTPLQDVQFNLNTFKGLTYDGFSDHTEGITAAITALAYGAQVIEKHFTLDKDLPGPDHQGSATPKELFHLCQYRDELSQMTNC